jgi:hypothetical protein
MSADPIPPDDDVLPPGLAALEADVVARLDREQGRWRSRPLALRVLQLALPLLAVVVMAVLLLPTGRGWSASVVLAGITSLLALAGVVVAPQRPAVGERIAQLATVVALVAFGLELRPMMPGTGSVGVGCLSMTAIMALGVSALTMASLAVSGLPLRLWHRVGLATAAVLGSAMAVWHHCAADTVAHVVVGHVTGPLLVGVVLVVVPWWRRRRAVTAGSDVG